MGLGRSKTIEILRKRGLLGALAYAWRKQGGQLEDGLASLYYKALWRLGRPLPRNYRGLVIYGGVSGGAALSSFLKHSAGVDTISSWGNNFGKIDRFYGATYRIASRPSQGLLIYCHAGFDCYSREESARFFSLCDKEVPVIFLVRDPISRLKGYANHSIDIWEHKSDMLTLMHDPDRMLNRIAYHGSIDEPMRENPSPESIKHFFTKQDIFWTYSLLKMLPRTKEILYLDMSEITGDRTWDTLVDLSTRFDLPQPKLEDKDFFCKKHWDTVTKLGQLSLLAHPSHIGKAYSPAASLTYYQMHSRNTLLRELGPSGARLFFSKNPRHDLRDPESNTPYKDITTEILGLHKIYIYIYIYILCGLRDSSLQCRALRGYEGLCAPLHASPRSPRKARE